jgi:hypothetical protein
MKRVCSIHRLVLLGQMLPVVTGQHEPNSSPEKSKAPPCKRRGLLSRNLLSQMETVVRILTPEASQNRAVKAERSEPGGRGLEGPVSGRAQAGESPEGLVAACARRVSWRYVRSQYSPENPWCEWPTTLVELESGETIVVTCNASSRAKCGPCGEKYRRRVGRVFVSGFTDDARLRMYFVTLTAPGGRAHCQVHKKCEGLGPKCDRCPCTPEGGVDLHEWNHSAGSRWNRFLQDMRREFGWLEYAKAAEIQQRGAIHFHAPIRVEGPANLEKARGRIKELAIAHGFGHSVDVQRIIPDEAQEEGDFTGEGAAWYCAKYVSKSADDRGQVPTLDAGGAPVLGAPRVRVWTSSRRWGLTMKALRAVQREWAAQAAAGDPLGDAAPLGPQAPLDTSSESYTGDNKRTYGVAEKNRSAGADSG